MKMVSAIMPTRGRPEFAQQALRSFLSQIEPPIKKELIILDDEDEPSFSNQWDFPANVRYARTDHRMSIGAKRNECCRLAQGDIFMHFDSDDWSAPFRMADQVQRLERSGLMVTGYKSMLFYQVETNLLFRYHNNFPSYAVGTSLTFLRPWWEKCPFPEDVVWGEDNAIVAVAAQQKQIALSDAGSLMVARIHLGNSCKKDLCGDSYIPVDLTQLPEEFKECVQAHYGKL